MWNWTGQHDTTVGKEKIGLPDMNQTDDLPNTRWALYPLS